MVSGMVWVLLGMLEIKLMVVLNLLRLCVNVSMMFVSIFGKVNGSVMVKKICIGDVFKVCVVCLSF